MTDVIIVCMHLCREGERKRAGRWAILRVSENVTGTGGLL